MGEPLSIAFVWHMHQPFYRQSVDGRYSMPWVRLHAVKDYLHIAHIIADYPTIHQTINVVPSLGTQLLEYAAGTAYDRVLELCAKLADGATPLSDDEKQEILSSFFSINWDHFVLPVPRYSQLAQLRELAHGDPTIFSDQYFLDLAVWYNLAWIDPSERSRDEVLRALVAKERCFDRANLQTVLARHRDICGKILPTYRELEQRGQLELTTSPFYHPILPLLIDTQSARESSPDLPLPHTRFTYPGDARDQVAAAIEYHHRTFGQAPRGLWPPEGAISQAAVELLEEFPSIAWIASDEHVLARSIRRPIERDEFGHVREPATLYQPYRLESGPAILFRDQTLSDRVGFVYQHWNSVDAANDLVERLLQIQRSLAAAPPVEVPPIVSVVLDGENCWETYPNNGDDFLRALFERLSRESTLRTVTPSEYLAGEPNRRDQLVRLPTIVAASWIASNLETWIGESDQNRAWEYLAATRHQLASWLAANGPSPERAWQALHVAEGSDWFWWYYSHNRVTSIDAFDRHFREELATVFREMGQPAPAWLAKPVFGQAAARRRDVFGLVSPLPLTARATAGPEWAEAGYADLSQSTGAMQAGQRFLERIYAGYDAECVYVRVEFGSAVTPASLAIYIRTRPALPAADGVATRQANQNTGSELEPATWQVRPSESSQPPRIAVVHESARGWREVEAKLDLVVGERAIELAVPWASFALERGALVEVTAADARQQKVDGPGPATEGQVAFTLGDLLPDGGAPSLAEGVHHA